MVSWGNKIQCSLKKQRLNDLSRAMINIVARQALTLTLDAMKRDKAKLQRQV